MGYLRAVPYALTAVLSLSAMAGSDAELQEYAKQAGTIRENADNIVGDFDPNDYQRDDEAAQSITLSPNGDDYRSALSAMGIEADPSPLLTDKERCEAGERSSCEAIDTRLGTFIFISSSMRDSEIRSALAHAVTSNAEVIVRGVQPGESIDQSFRLWFTLADAAGVEPEVRLDPELFKRFDVQSVPTIVHTTDAGVARVSGMANAQWLIEQVSINGLQDFGLRGTTVEIAEKDLIQEMKERIAKVDWDDQTSQARKRMWGNFDYIDLPSASETSSLLLDPTMTVTRDVVTPDGQLIAAAGTQLNSLETIGLSRRYLVFDPTNHHQFDYVKTKYLAGDWSDKPLTILFTQVNQDDASETLQKLFGTFRTKAYLYTDIIQAKFNLKALPSTIEQSGRQLLINTYKPTDTGD